MASGLYYKQYGDRDRARAALLQALQMVPQPKLTMMESTITDAIAGL